MVPRSINGLRYHADVAAKMQPRERCEKPVELNVCRPVLSGESYRASPDRLRIPNMASCFLASDHPKRRANRADFTSLKSNDRTSGSPDTDVLTR